MDKISKPTVFLKSLTFSDGRTYSLSGSEKLLLVGPNNAGKSQALREIKELMGRLPGQQGSSGQVVTGISQNRTGNASTLKSYLAVSAEMEGAYYLVGTSQIYIEHVPFFDLDNIGPVAEMFCRHVTTENRLNASIEVESVAAGQRKTSAQHHLYDSETLAAKISDLFELAFGQSLVIDYRGGRSIPIHVGLRPTLKPGQDRLSDDYVTSVRSLPRLQLQGDGMRSYAGILFESVVTKHDITLIDEPEAFLHPPQMRKLARTLVDEIPGQLIVSTHSSDVLRGFLDSSPTDVRVIRLQRDGSVNRTTETSAEVVRELWENPDLKYTNALDGIFHEQCIVCEDDSDCRFYNAILDYLAKKDRYHKWPDTIFVPCGGKGAIPKLASALRTLGVPCKVVVDIDVLADKKNFQAIVESVGGKWTAIETEWKVVDADVRKGVRAMDDEAIKKAIRQILDTRPGVARGDIVAAMKQNQPWASVKQVGKPGLPRGSATLAFDRMDQQLRTMGVFIVPVGEIEGFASDAGLHGPSFVSKVLRTTSIGSPKLKAAREFVQAFCSR